MADCMHDIEEAWCGICTPAKGAESPLTLWVNSVSMVIPGDGENPLSVDECAARADLTRHEFNQAVAAIRERHPDLPLVSDRNGIRFTMDQMAVNKFRRAGAGQAMTLIRRRFRGAVLPYLRNVVSDREAAHMAVRVEVLLEDMQRMADAGLNGGAAS